MRQSHRGITLVEFLICLTLLLIVLVMFGPHLFERSIARRINLNQVLSHMKELSMATQQMVQDGESGTNYGGWPGDIGGSFTNWAAHLVKGEYLTTNDLSELLSAPGRRNPRDTMPGANTNGVLVYAVGSNSAMSAVFLSSANFTNTPGGGVAPGSEARPFGDYGFVVFRRGGEGAILKAREAGDTNKVGAFVPLCQ